MTVLDPAPVRLADVLDPSWLSTALTDVADGERVVESRVVDSLKTIASKIRFEAVVERPDGTRTTRHYCVKGCFGEGGRAGMLELEARVYRDVRPVVDVRMPRAAYASTDVTSGRSVIILEDILANGGTLLNALTPYPPETIEGTLAQLARLHAATWGEEGRARFDWLPRSTIARADFPIDLVQELLNDGRGPDLPPYLRDAAKVKEAVTRVTDGPPICIVHGDAHSGNAYMDRTGQAGWYDWQCIHAGHWATDVSYHIGTALETDLRRRHEKALLQRYLDELAQLGQEPPPWDEAWEEYCLHLAYGYWMWSITRFHSRAVVLEHIPRLGNAIVDHGTFERLGI